MGDDKGATEEVPRRREGARSRKRKEEMRRSRSSPGITKDSSTSEMEEEEEERRGLVKSRSTPEPPKPALRKARKPAEAKKEAKKEEVKEAKKEEVKEEEAKKDEEETKGNKEEVEIKTEAVVEPVVEEEVVKVDVKQELQAKKEGLTLELKEEKPEKDSWWKMLGFGRKRSKSVEPEHQDSVDVPRRQSLTKEEGPRKRRPMRESKGSEDLRIDDTDETFWKNEVTKASLKMKVTPPDEKGGRLSWGQLMRDTRLQYRIFVLEHPEDARKLRLLCNRCLSDFILVLIYCGLGAFLFKFTEGAFESFYKCGVKRVKRDFIDELWKGSHYMREDEWKSKARRKLLDFENQLQEAFEAGLTTYSGQKSWTFLNSVIYCLTVVSTIGYGHIAPSTVTGRALTIVYAVFGIPMFLILLADFGKMFTRGIKWIWAFVRRVYYTGSCKKVRKTVPVQGVMKGVQVMYDMATFRRPSQVQEGGEGTGGGVQQQQQQQQEEEGAAHSPISCEPPSTPAPSNFAIDDEFNLPITVAIVILVIYIMCGASVFWFWEEDWTFFDAFYFVFISMSTIGFGDLVPKNKMYMMASIVYLAFGLALTTMCINVVQEKLSDTFRQATSKIGATIGLTVSREDGTITPASPANIELAQIHKSPTQS